MGTNCEGPAPSVRKREDDRPSFHVFYKYDKQQLFLFKF